MAGSMPVTAQLVAFQCCSHDIDHSPEHISSAATEAAPCLHLCGMVLGRLACDGRSFSSRADFGFLGF